MTTVSVIIPNFDDTATVPRAVESAMATAVDTEVVIVDNTGDAELEELAWSEDVRLVRTEPQTPGANRNAGLRVATGDYVQFLDADDWLVVGGLAPRVWALRDAQATVAVGQTRRQELDGETTVVDIGPPPERPGAAYLRYEWTPTLGAMLCEREVFAEHRFWESLPRAQDFHLWARVFHEFDVEYVEGPAFTYVQTPDQRARQRIHQRFAAQRRACRDLHRRHSGLRSACRWRWSRSWSRELDWYLGRAGLPTTGYLLEKWRRDAAEKRDAE